MQAALEYFLLYYREHKLDHTYVYPGVLDTLQAIRQRSNLKMAVLTNKPINPSRAHLRGPGALRIYVADLRRQQLCRPRSPIRTARACCWRSTTCCPREAIMIGDSQNDVLTANNAGMFSIGVNYGFSPESLQIHPPDALIDHPEELLELLEIGRGAKR